MDTPSLQTKQPQQIKGSFDLLNQIEFMFCAIFTELFGSFEQNDLTWHHLFSIGFLKTVLIEMVTKLQALNK